MPEYRIKLDVYSGPLDLLLFLIRRDEVDIYDIPIARVTEQYLGYVEMLKHVDLNLAGEFMVMAATLMEIKSAMLCPRPQMDGTGEPMEDPRLDLVRQLLEYKQFKDAADQLGQSAHVQALRYPREPAAEIPGMPEKKELDLEDVQVWDLLEAFDRLMASVSLRGAVHEVVYDDTPIDVHAEDLLDRLHSEGPMTFQTIFQGRQSKSEMIGLFLALLELIRRRLVRVEQDQLHGTIYISPRNPDEEVVAPAEPFGAEAPQDASPPEPAPPELPDTVPQLSPSAETHEVVPNNQFDSSTGHV